MASSGYVTGVREQAMGGWSLLAVVVGIGQDAGGAPARLCTAQVDAMTHASGRRRLLSSPGLAATTAHHSLVAN